MYLEKGRTVDSFRSLYYLTDTMSNNEVFFHLKQGRVEATATASGNPTLVDPVAMEPVTVYSPLNGGYILNTAVSGTLIYAHGVDPSYYPQDEQERQLKRLGTIK